MAEIKAMETAHKVIKEFDTRECFFIAEKSGIKIVFQSWHPVTFGEYDKQTKTIYVNRRALLNGDMSKELIVAHELGHFFAAEFGYDRKTEEKFAKEFAAELLK